MAKLGRASHRVERVLIEFVPFLTLLKDLGSHTKIISLVAYQAVTLKIAKLKTLL